jgi:single-strand DNA-binding protein
MKKGLNHWSVIGNVGKDPEVRYTNSGTAVCNFSVAINSAWKNADGELQEHTEWVYVVAWKRLAEIIGEYVKKGSPIFVEGRAQTTSYEHEGIKKYKTELVADNIILLGGKRDGEGGAPDEPSGPPTAEKDDLPF